MNDCWTTRILPPWFISSVTPPRGSVIGPEADGVYAMRWDLPDWVNDLIENSIAELLARILDGK